MEGKRRPRCSFKGMLSIDESANCFFQAGGGKKMETPRAQWILPDFIDRRGGRFEWPTI